MIEGWNTGNREFCYVLWFPFMVFGDFERGFWLIIIFGYLSNPICSVIQKLVFLCNSAGNRNVKNGISACVKLAMSVAVVINHIVNLTTCARLYVKK